MAIAVMMCLSVGVRVRHADVLFKICMLTRPVKAPGCKFQPVLRPAWAKLIVQPESIKTIVCLQLGITRILSCTKCIQGKVLVSVC